MTPAAATKPRWSIGVGGDEAADRFEARDDRGQGDHRDDEQAGEVFCSSVPVGVAPSRWSSGEAERDEQWDGRERVAEVVDGVGDEGDRAGDQNDHELQRRRDQ